jgi:quercetin dioxygenase-like cupin family protein
MLVSGDAKIGPWDESTVRWLAGQSLGGSHGAAVEVTLPPGGAYDIHTLGDNERVVYLYSGMGTHTGTGGSTTMSTDDVLVLDGGTWHGFENTGSGPAKLWIAWAPAVEFPADDFVLADESTDVSEGQMTKRNLKGNAEDPSTTPTEQGFEELGIIWDGADGSDAITLGWAHFETGGTHHMHRHTLADEVLHVATGTGMHTTPDRETPMIGPAYDFAPAGEWHKMIVPEGRMEGMFLYIGGNTLEATGYELEEA